MMGSSVRQVVRPVTLRGRERARRVGIVVFVNALVILLVLVLLRDEDGVPTVRPEEPPRPIASQPPSTPVTDAAVTEEIADAAVPDAPAAAASSPAGTAPAISLPGNTPLQRRLVAGNRFRDMALAIGQGAFNPEDLLQAYCKLQHTILLADWRTRGLERLAPTSDALMLPGRVQQVARNCELLAPCRLELVKLAGRRLDEDALGEKRFLRVWNHEGAYPLREMATAEATLRHIETVAMVAPHHGYDVIATPERGNEVLPNQGGNLWALGIYWQRDRYSTMVTHLREGFRIEVLEHEMIHALCHRHFGENRPPRFIAEGLAEYLRHVEPGDDGYAFPAVRVADELAALDLILKRLEALECSVRDLDPRALLALPSQRFYELRHLGYLLALAAMTFIGAEPIESAFLAKDYEPIARAIRGMDAAEFLESLATLASHGDAVDAIIVTDIEVGIDEGDDLPPRLRPPYEALVDIGLMRRAWRQLKPDQLKHQPGPAVSGGESMQDLFTRLAEGGTTILLLADQSTAAQGPFALDVARAAPCEWLDLEQLDVRDRVSFAQGFCAQLREEAAGATVEMRALSERFEKFDVRQMAQVVPYSTAKLGSRLDTLLGGTQAMGEVVFLVASRDEEARADLRLGSDAGEDLVRSALEARYRAALHRHRNAIRCAIVVDLSNGEGDALPLARGLASLWDAGAPVGYWNPQSNP